MSRTSATAMAPSNSSTDNGINNSMENLDVGFFVVSTLLSISGTVGNCLVIIAVISNRKLHRTHTLFVVNLSIADLFGCIVWLTLCFYGLLKGFSVISELCITLVLTMLAVFGVSTINLALIAVNRFCLITQKRSTYQKLFTKWHIAWMLVMSWLWGIITIIPGIYVFSRNTQVSTWTVALCPTDDSIIKFMGLRHFMSLCGAVVALSTATVCYFRIWRAVQRSAQRAYVSDVRRTVSDTNGYNRKRELRLTRDLCILFTAFSVCVIPYILFQLIDWNYRLLPLVVHRIGVLLMWTNSVCNPYFYAWRNREFRNSARKLLGIIMCKSGKRSEGKSELELNNVKLTTEPF